MAGYDQNVGAKRAREARAELGLHPQAPLECLLTAVEDAGVPVVVGRLRDGVAGAYQHRGAFRLVFVHGAQPLGRQRFTLAHELGHIRCRHDGGVVVDDARTLQGHVTTSREVQANAFAAEFLVPKAAIERLVDRDPDLDLVVRLADRYGTSAPAMLIRLSTCDAVSARRAQRLRAEIAAGEHTLLARHLGLAGPDDRLCRIDELPYVSPALEGSALAAVIRGECTVAEAARTAGVAAAALAGAVEVLAAP